MTPVIQSGITELASENVSGVYVDEQEKQNYEGPVDSTTTTVQLPNRIETSTQPSADTNSIPTRAKVAEKCIKLIEVNH